MRSAYDGSPCLGYPILVQAVFLGKTVFNIPFHYMIQIEGSDSVGLASFVLEFLTLEVKPKRPP